MKQASVVGGGIVGLNVALALQHKGWTVTVLDPEPVRTGASYGNAGHIAIEQVEPLASPAMIRLAARRLYPRGALALPVGAVGHWLPFSLKLMAAAGRFAAGKAALSELVCDAMAAWVRRVEDIGAPDLLRQDGHYVVWESQASARAGVVSWQGTDTGQARFGPADLERVQALVGVPLAGGIRFENTGRVTDLPRLLTALEAAFVARGGVVRHEHVARLSDVKADAVVVCAGVRSKGLMESVGLKVPMIAERGYHIQSPASDWPADLPPVVFEDRSMIVTRFEGGLRAASFVEFSTVDAPPDEGKWRRLERHVGELGLPFSDAPARWMGARPTLPDYLPAIGRAGDGLYYAFGHQHLGLTLGPVTGEMVADMVEGGEVPSAFSLERFQ